MSYIEVLLAAALLSIFIVPVASGFLVASQNQRYALAAYEASLYTANLLTEAGTGNYETLLQSPDFAAEYKTDIYDYRLRVFSRGSGVLSLEYFDSTNSELESDASGLMFSGDSFPRSTAAQIMADADCSVILTGDTDIFVNTGNDITITCENVSGAPALLTVYTQDPEKTVINCVGGDAWTTVLFTGTTPRERIAAAESYDKNGLLLNKLAVPIIYR